MIIPNAICSLAVQNGHRDYLAGSTRSECLKFGHDRATGVAKADLHRENSRQSGSDDEHDTPADALRKLSEAGVPKRRATARGPL
jgi:hypothetical protein